MSNGNGRGCLGINVRANTAKLINMITVGEKRDEIQIWSDLFVKDEAKVVNNRAGVYVDCV